MRTQLLYAILDQRLFGPQVIWNIVVFIYPPAGDARRAAGHAMLARHMVEVGHFVSEALNLMRSSMLSESKT